MNSQSVGSVAILTWGALITFLTLHLFFPMERSEGGAGKERLESFLFIFGVSIELLIKLTLPIEWVAQQCMSMSYRVAFDSIESSITPITFVTFFTYFFVPSQN